MPTFYPFPKIVQFRQVVKNITHQAQFQGFGDDGEPIMDRNAKLPTLTFTGTVKIHGTNAGIGWDGEQLWAQSRTRIITPESDNYGFAAWVYANKKAIIDTLAEWRCIVGTYTPLLVYGEWAGKGINSGAAICELDKKFYCFDVQSILTEISPTKPIIIELAHNADTHCYNPEIGWYRILPFTYHLDINFSKPEEAQNDLARITEEVEKECPVAKSFGVSGVGEGVVWTATYKGKVHRFKVKGEKHSATKVKTLASVDVELINGIREFVEYAVTENRVKQAIQQVCAGAEFDPKSTGKILSWLVSDIYAEEADTISKNNLQSDSKRLNREIANKARSILFS